MRRPSAKADRKEQRRARLRFALTISEAFCAAFAGLLPTNAIAASKVRISALSDASFGSLSNLSADAIQSQSLCLYSKSPPANNYDITASGSGPGGAFALSSGTDTLPFEVQWSDTPAQTSGSRLLPNQPLPAQHSSAAGGSVDDCSSGPATTASLIIILRSAVLGAATSGTYTGTLTLLVAPE